MPHCELHFRHLMRGYGSARRGQPCRILTPDTNSTARMVQVEYTDGYTQVIPRNLLQRRRPEDAEVVSKGALGLVVCVPHTWTSTQVENFAHAVPSLRNAGWVVKGIESRCDHRASHVHTLLRELMD